MDHGGMVNNRLRFTTYRPEKLYPYYQHVEEMLQIQKTAHM